MTVYWLPGEHHGLVWPGGMAMIDGGLARGLAVDLWQRCRDGVDMGQFLEALAKCAGSSLLSLPSFAVALESGVISHVAARGAINIDLVLTSGLNEQISGTQVSTWVERQLSHVAGLRITMDSVAPEVGVELPTSGGLVPAASICSGDWTSEPARREFDIEMDELTVQRLPEAPTPEASAQPRPRVVPADPSVNADAIGLVGNEADASFTGSSAGEAPPGILDSTAVEEQSLVVQQELLGPAEDPVAGSPEAAEPASQPAVEQFDQSGQAATPHTLGPTVLPETFISADGTPPVASPMIAMPAPKSAPSQFDLLWGETQVVLVDEAAVAPASEDASTPGSDPALIDGIPAQMLADIDDHDSMTVVSLDEAPAAAPVSNAAVPAAGSVVAITCPMDHLNPTHRSLCRVCEAPLLGEPTRIPRPGLGWLRSPEGERIELLTPIIIGRNPRADRVQGTDLPRLIPLPNGHISSNHLAIRLEGWNVLAVDLQSRNGTYLRRPGQPPMRLPEQPTMLLSGDVLDLGHGVQFSFEELP